jgi:hypothetical protein
MITFSNDQDSRSPVTSQTFPPVAVAKMVFWRGRRGGLRRFRLGRSRALHSFDKLIPRQAWGEEGNLAVCAARQQAPPAAPRP